MAIQQEIAKQESISKFDSICVELSWNQVSCEKKTQLEDRSKATEIPSLPTNVLNDRQCLSLVYLSFVNTFKAAACISRHFCMA